jgi:hypothetical protein
MMRNDEDPHGRLNFPQDFWDCFDEEGTSASCSRAEQQQADRFARLEGEFAESHEMDDLGPVRIFASPPSRLAGKSEMV